MKHIFYMQLWRRLMWERASVYHDGWFFCLLFNKKEKCVMFWWSKVLTFMDLHLMHTRRRRTIRRLWRSSCHCSLTRGQAYRLWFFFFEVYKWIPTSTTSAFVAVLHLIAWNTTFIGNLAFWSTLNSILYFNSKCFGFEFAWMWMRWKHTPQV